MALFRRVTTDTSELNTALLSIPNSTNQTPPSSLSPRSPMSANELYASLPALFPSHTLPPPSDPGYEAALAAQPPPLSVSGSYAVLIPESWHATWVAHLAHPPGPHPGPVPTSSLLAVSSSSPPQAHAISLPAWDFIAQKYGGGPRILRAPLDPTLSARTLREAARRPVPHATHHPDEGEHGPGQRGEEDESVVAFRARAGAAVRSQSAEFHRTNRQTPATSTTTTTAVTASAAASAAAAATAISINTSNDILLPSIITVIAFPPSSPPSSPPPSSQLQPHSFPSRPITHCSPPASFLDHQTGVVTGDTDSNTAGLAGRARAGYAGHELFSLDRLY